MRAILSGALALPLLAGLASAEPVKAVARSEVPAAVEAELATREVLCRLDNLGELVIPADALGRSDLNDDGRDEFILALCRLACSGSTPKIATACDQSLIFVSHSTGYDTLRMSGEILDIRRAPGLPTKLLSSAFSGGAACPVADGVCNALYEIRNGELIGAGIE